MLPRVKRAWSDISERHSADSLLHAREEDLRPEKRRKALLLMHAVGLFGLLWSRT